MNRVMIVNCPAQKCFPALLRLKWTFYSFCVAREWSHLVAMIVLEETVFPVIGLVCHGLHELNSVKNI